MLMGGKQVVALPVVKKAAHTSDVFVYLCWCSLFHFISFFFSLSLPHTFCTSSPSASEENTLQKLLALIKMLKPTLTNVGNS